mmetsp:Transcript_8739/g.18624  ORF Transcript_8739/g.18624 Transcript_8739/m.18624 type:complete len:230 (-) Transcript_8739:1961-2650(-)
MLLLTQAWQTSLHSCQDDCHAAGVIPTLVTQTHHGGPTLRPACLVCRPCQHQGARVAGPAHATTGLTTHVMEHVGGRCHGQLRGCGPVADCTLMVVVGHTARHMGKVDRSRVAIRHVGHVRHAMPSSHTSCGMPHVVPCCSSQPLVQQPLVVEHLHQHLAVSRVVGVLPHVLLNQLDRPPVRVEQVSGNHGIRGSCIMIHAIGGSSPRKLHARLLLHDSLSSSSLCCLC